MIDKIAKQVDVEWTGTGGQFDSWDELNALMSAIVKRFLKAGDIVVIGDTDGFQADLSGVVNDLLCGKCAI